ncbi:MAG: FKBP-type peptidyl-prolyl cis-trans isomerase [Bacteroidales bacterium]|nr:FKBP-type peptidyl-prolyl cis-trans isomerase [Bacteroidales bacterium]
MWRFAYLLFLISILTAVSCRERGGSKDVPVKINAEQLAEINRQLLIKDRERIISYIERKGLDMKETDTGLWISRDKGGEGRIKDGDSLTLEYVCSLLDGSVVYDSAKDGLMHFVVGRSDIPAGLNQAVKLLGKGSEAVLIIPAYLAYGLLGDERKIPARSVLVYNIKVLDVE